MFSAENTKNKPYMVPNQQLIDEDAPCDSDYATINSLKKSDIRTKIEETLLRTNMLRLDTSEPTSRQTIN
jgi:hypothetical protein